VTLHWCSRFNGEGNQLAFRLCTQNTYYKQDQLTSLIAASRPGGHSSSSMEALTSIKHAVAASPTETAIVVSVVAVLLGVYFMLTRWVQDQQQQVSHQSGWLCSALVAEA
jgi:hypothetical protein